VLLNDEDPGVKIDRLINKKLGEESIALRASVTSARLYVPGPHTGSDSGKYKNTAQSTFVDTVRKTLSIANGLPSESSVLSTTACRGKPVDDGEGEMLGVCDAVPDVDGETLGVML
jgi:hypothetical protein